MTPRIPVGERTVACIRETWPSPWRERVEGRAEECAVRWDLGCEGKIRFNEDTQVFGMSK